MGFINYFIANNQQQFSIQFDCVNSVNNSFFKAV